MACPGFLDREFRRGIGLQPLLGNRHAAAHRTAVRAVVQPLQGTVQGIQPLSQGLGDRVVLTLGGQPLGGILDVARLGHVILGLPVLLACPFGTSAWTAGALVCAYAAAPRLTRLVCGGLAALTVADWLQYAWTWTQRTTDS